MKLVSSGVNNNMMPNTFPPMSKAESDSAWPNAASALLSVKAATISPPVRAKVTNKAKANTIPCRPTVIHLMMPILSNIFSSIIDIMGGRHYPLYPSHVGPQTHQEGRKMYSISSRWIIIPIRNAISPTFREPIQHPSQIQKNLVCLNLQKAKFLPMVLLLISRFRR